MSSWDEARSRKKKGTSSGNGSSISDIGNGIYISDSGDSRARSDRLAKRKLRVKKARARKGIRHNNAAMLCVIASSIFSFYLLVCLVFFHNLPEGEQQQRGMRGLVQRVQNTKQQLSSKVKRLRHNGNLDQIVPSQAVGVPVGKWPVSIRDEEGQFEEINHPGFEDGHVKMSVPSFWAKDPVAIHENKLMSRERALSIGTCLNPDPTTGSYTRGDTCPLSERTIFVAIASYRDWQCRDTVTSIFQRATHPERVRVAVVDQIVDGEDGSCDVPHSPCAEDPNQPICLYRSQLDVFQMDAQLAVGPVFARHIGHRLYRGEYYSMQSDGM